MSMKNKNTLEVGDIIRHYTETQLRRRRGGCQYIGIIVDIKADEYSVFWFHSQKTYEHYVKEELVKVS